jgi:hypothetical protein
VRQLSLLLVIVAFGQRSIDRESFIGNSPDNSQLNMPRGTSVEKRQQR